MILLAIYLVTSLEMMIFARYRYTNKPREEKASSSSSLLLHWTTCLLVSRVIRKQTGFPDGNDAVTEWFWMTQSRLSSVVMVKCEKKWKLCQWQFQSQLWLLKLNQPFHFDTLMWHIICDEFRIYRAIDAFDLPFFIVFDWALMMNTTASVMV